MLNELSTLYYFFSDTIVFYLLTTQTGINHVFLEWCVLSLGIPAVVDSYNKKLTLKPLQWTLDLKILQFLSWKHSFIFFTHPHIFNICSCRGRVTLYYMSVMRTMYRIGNIMRFVQVNLQILLERNQRQLTTIRTDGN